MVIRPYQRQLDFLDWEFGVFFHFGIRSFYHGHTDWDGRPMPAIGFNPDRLDCRQWCRVTAAAGAKYAILVAKHHDGFANWPSQYSDYSVKDSPWKDGKGDVVKEFTDACREYHLKVGLYYSPAQWGGTVSFEKPEEYDDYFVAQISELLTNYGTIDYLWFDGCGSDNHEYDRERIVRTIRSLQPDIRIFSMWDPDTIWVGNEDGYANAPGDNIHRENFAAREDGSGKDIRWLPAECDMKLRSAWFDCESNEDTVKSVEDLMSLYEYSVGRGANLLLNVGPDCHGVIPEKDAERLAEFGKALRRRYGAPLPFGKPNTTENETSVLLDDRWNDFSGEMVNTVVVEEDLTEGQKIRSFVIEARIPCGQVITVYRGETVGHKAICRFPAIRTWNLRLRVTDSEGESSIRDMKAYYTKDC